MKNPCLDIEPIINDIIKGINQGVFKQIEDIEEQFNVRFNSKQIIRIYNTIYPQNESE